MVILAYFVVVGIKHKTCDRIRKQAGAELGQAQLKLGLGFTSTNLHRIARQLSLIVLTE